MNDFLIQLASNPTNPAGLVALVMSLSGYFLIKNINSKENSPLMPYFIQILGMCFLLPVILLMAIVLKINNEAVIGLLGTIVGYVFGTSNVSSNSRNNNNSEN